MENNNFSFKPGGINPSNQVTDNQISTNKMNIDYQTTEPNSSNIHDIVQKQKKLYDDIITLSSNLNLNFDLNENNNMLNNNINNNNDYHKITENLQQTKFNPNQKNDFLNISSSNNNNIEYEKGNQSKKLDELINKFNNLYSSENNNERNEEDNIHVDNKMNVNEFFTLSNDNTTNNNNINNISCDHINNNKIISNLNEQFQNKSTDNIIIPKSEINILNNDRKILNYNSKKQNNIALNSYYSTNNNRQFNKRNYIHEFVKPKLKSHSTNQISKSYRNTPEKKVLNKFYQNINKNNNPELSTISYKANMVINEFKKTLLEAEKMENELNKSKYSVKTYAGLANGNNIINTRTNMNLNQTNTDIITNNSFLNTNNSKNYYLNNNNEINENYDEYLYEDNEIDKIKIQNQILQKSNQALKNRNKILTHEINSYKNNSIYKDPFSECDKDLNNYIQDLKTSLENATQSNEELETIINNTQKENKILNEKIQELLSNFEMAKNECEKMAKENSELKVELENKLEETNNNEDNLNKLKKEITNLNNIINDNKNQINYLNSLQESNKVSQKDNEDLILELKNTIENLQKINLENNNEILDLKNKIEEYKTNINSKQNEINTLNENITEKEITIKNKDNQLKEYSDLLNETKTKNSQSKNEIQNINIEKEKYKNEIKTLKMLLADRERTISAQKNSISFLTKTFNNNLNMINNNINNAMMNDDNENIDANKGLKIMVEKMQKEIYELNKKNNKNEKERLQLEKDLNEFNEQYEQIKFDYQLLHQKYIEQNKIIEVLKKEFLKRNNEKELQHLTKVNFDILGKLKKSENENLIKTQQLEQLKKNYELMNNQFMEFTTNNYNIQSNNYSDINDINYENIGKNSNNNENPEINNKIINNKKFTESQNTDDNLHYSYLNNSAKINSSENMNNDIKNDFINNHLNVNNLGNITEKGSTNLEDINFILTKNKEPYNNYNLSVTNSKSYTEPNNNISKNNIEDINIKTESNENFINNSDKNNIDTINIEENKINADDNIMNSARLNNNLNENYSEEIKEVINQDNNSLSGFHNKYNSSSQMQMENNDLLSNLEKPTNSNEYTSHSMKLQIKNDYNLMNFKNNNNKNTNQKDKPIKDLENQGNITEEIVDTNFIQNIEKDQSLIPYPNIYTIKGNKIINFNLFEKKFILINPKDQTNGLFAKYISDISTPPLTLNTQSGFFILIKRFIFIYNTINNTIYPFTQILSSHEEGGFIYINDEIYSLSGKDCLLCEKYSNEKNLKIRLPSVNFARVNAGYCNINNEYLYVFFGNNCENSIERLNLNIDYESMKDYINNWEHMEVYTYNLLENEEKINLERFTLFLDDYNNVIILGGNDNKDNENQDIYGFNLDNNKITTIGKIDSSALYIGQNIQLDDSIFAIYDTKNGLHFFNKELDYHEIYNFNI